MSTNRRRPARIFGYLLPIAILPLVAIWALLQPVRTTAQQAGPATADTMITATTISDTVQAVTATVGTALPTNSRPTATPTPGITVVTPTPEPPNVFAAATNSVQLTTQATRVGTPTPLPRSWRIATRTPLPRVVTVTPTAANSATATAYSLHATAVAFTTGTPYVVVATPAPTSTPTPTDFVVTPTPRPADVLEAATRKAEQEAESERGITSTPLPENFVVATVTSTPRIVTNTPTAANEATATAHAIHATAVAYTTGVPNVVTATPTNTPTPRPPTATPKATNTAAPAVSTPTLAALPTLPPTETPTLVPILTPTGLLTPISTDLPPLASQMGLSVPPATPSEPILAEPLTFYTTRRGMRAVVEGYIDVNQVVRYHFNGEACQRVRVALRSRYGYPTTAEISTAEGNILGLANEDQGWRGQLPATQEYYLTVQIPADGIGHDYKLMVELQYKHACR